MFSEGGEDNSVDKEQGSDEESEIDAAEARFPSPAATEATSSLFVPSSPETTPAVINERHHHCKNPCPPAQEFVTERYKLYEPGCNLIRESAGRFQGKFEIFDDYKLVLGKVLGKVIDIAEIPHYGVRLDDLAVAKVLESGKFTQRERMRRWRAEFDGDGMVRLGRIPLGYAAKMYVKAGDEDMDGNTVQPGQEGYYYKWWPGVHCLMGKEGYDKGLYKARPYERKFKVREAMGFKIKSRAVIQKPEGEDELALSHR